MANDQLTFVVTCRSADNRVLGEHIEGADDFTRAGLGSIDLMTTQVTHDAFKILDDAGRQPDARHPIGPACGPPAA